MGFRALRVINQDRVQPGHGFPMHPHRDFEILSYVLDGQLEHRDTMGSISVIDAGELQAISAGTRMAHSEQNPSQTAPVYFLQVWIEPNERGGPPHYSQIAFSDEQRRGRPCLAASPDGREDSLPIRQDAEMYVSLLEPGKQVEHALAAGRGAWLHVATGAVDLNGQRLLAGDGAAIADTNVIELAHWNFIIGCGQGVGREILRYRTADPRPRPPSLSGRQPAEDPDHGQRPRPASSPRRPLAHTRARMRASVPARGEVGTSRLAVLTPRHQGEWRPDAKALVQAPAQQTGLPRRHEDGEPGHHGRGQAEQQRAQVGLRLGHAVRAVAEPAVARVGDDPPIPLQHHRLAPRRERLAHVTGSREAVHALAQGRGRQ